jgi:hypothetical protein
MVPVNLDKLVTIGKKAFNHAAKERRKLLATPRGKMPKALPSLRLEAPGAEFYIWNHENPAVKARNSSDDWYSNFHEAHTEVDAFTARAMELLTVSKYVLKNNFEMKDKRIFQNVKKCS